MQNNIEPSLDTWTIIFLLAAGQGFFLALLFLIKRPFKIVEGEKINSDKASNTLLGLFILTFSLTLVDYLGFWTHYNVYAPHFFNVWQVYVFLFGPLLFLYLKTTTVQHKLRLKDSLHFLPALWIFLYNMPYWMLSSTSKINSLSGIYDEEFLAAVKMLPSIYSYLKWLILGHLSTYALVMGQMFFSKKEKITASTKLQGCRALWWLYVGFVLSYWLYYGLVGMGWLTPTFDYMISFAMSIFIYAVGYMGYQGLETRPMLSKIIPLQNVIEEKPKYQSSSLTTTAAQSLLHRIMEIMDRDKPYLEPDLRLAALAEQVHSTPHHVSQVINEQLGKSFSDFVNEYRIKAAQEMLLDPHNKSVYIINIAYSVGFNNKTSFNQAFKQAVGVSPSEFRKSAVVNG